MGGKPSKGTPRDQRLKENRPTTRKGKSPGGAKGTTFGTTTRPPMPRPKG